MGILDKLFGLKGKTIIQCDENKSLVWKWRSEEKTSNKIPQDAILQVKNGEVAVVIGDQSSGDPYKYIEGPYHDSLSNAYGGTVSSVFFIVTQGNNQIKFAVPFFDMADPRNVDLLVPVAVRGSVTININDYRLFVKLNRLAEFTNETFAKQTKDSLIRNVKSVVASIPIQHGIPLVSLETQISQVNDIVQVELSDYFLKHFGINLTSLDISAISIDKESESYTTLKSITQDLSVQETKHQAELKLKIASAEADVEIKDLKDDQVEKMRVRREEANIDLMDKRQSIVEKHRAQRERTDLELVDKKKEIEEKYRAQREEAELIVKSQESIIEENQFALHAQTEESVRSGRIGSGIGSSGINLNIPQAQMVENLKRGVSPNGLTGSRKVNSTGVTPPKVEKNDDASYHIAIDNNQSGPYTIDQLSQLIKQGSLTSETLIWKKGMPRWVKADFVPELSAILRPSSSEETPPPLP